MFKFANCNKLPDHPEISGDFSALRRLCLPSLKLVIHPTWASRAGRWPDNEASGGRGEGDFFDGKLGSYHFHGILDGGDWGFLGDTYIYIFLSCQVLKLNILTGTQWLCLTVGDIVDSFEAPASESTSRRITTHTGTPKWGAGRGGSNMFFYPPVN